jgi:YHS domain-containing protein
MNSLLYFALWAALIFVMMRFGCGSHIMGHGGHRHRHGHGAGGQLPPVKAADPVCGMMVETATAKSSAYKGHVHYFCSQTCREKFEAAPETYLKTPPATQKPMEAHHGAH